MSQTLEQIALRIGEPLMDAHGSVNVVEFARRLVAALGGQWPCAWMWKNANGKWRVTLGPGAADEKIPLYAAPQPPQRIEGCMWAVTKGDRTICQPPKNPKLPQREGWQWVPKEPADAMIAASPYAFSEDTITMYKAMLAAAPKPEDKS